jgi:hypothetical protein
MFAPWSGNLAQVAGVWRTRPRAKREQGPVCGDSGARLRRMIVQISDPELLGSLMHFLRRCGCVVAEEEGGIVAVSIPRSFHEEAARLELDLLLRAWEAIHPDVQAIRLSNDHGRFMLLLPAGRRGRRLRRITRRDW